MKVRRINTLLNFKCFLWKAQHLKMLVSLQSFLTAINEITKYNDAWEAWVASMYRI